MRKLYITKIHIILEILSYVLIAVCFIIALIGVRTLSAEIATHYDLAGNPDGYGSPAALFVMPAVMLFCNMVMSGVVHFVNPDFWNMPFKVKETKKILVYRDIVSMMVWMELEMGLFTLVFTIMSYEQEMAGAMALSILLIAAFTGTVIGFCVRGAKHNK